MDGPQLSIVTPAWNEARNVPLLYDRLRTVLDKAGLAWEWIVVDDHSRDETFGAIEELAGRDARVRGVRLARNGGSHAAIACGLNEARGDAAVVLAADLQDPPEVIPSLVDRWRNGARVVWAARRNVPGSPRDSAFSRLYWWIMRHAVGMDDTPAAGADFFLVDRAVIDAFTSLRERHTSVFALITWLGFRQEQVAYDKQARLHGASGWTLRRKLKLVADSITGFSDLPVVVCWSLAVVLGAAGLVLGVAGVVGRSLGILGPPEALLLGATTFLAAIVLAMLAAVGEYVWRALDEIRGRPRYLVESRTRETARTAFPR